MAFLHFLETEFRPDKSEVYFFDASKSASLLPKPRLKHTQKLLGLSKRAWTFLLFHQILTPDRNLTMSEVGSNAQKWTKGVYVATTLNRKPDWKIPERKLCVLTVTLAIRPRVTAELMLRGRQNVSKVRLKNMKLWIRIKSLLRLVRKRLLIFAE